jgi:hypothetical protein
MLVASLVISLLGVFAAGVGAYLAFSAKAASYTEATKPAGGSIRRPVPLVLAFWYLVRDQRKAAAWALLGTALQCVSVLLALWATVRARHGS